MQEHECKGAIAILAELCACALRKQTGKRRWQNGSVDAYAPGRGASGHDMKNHRMKRKLNANSAEPATPLAIAGSAAVPLLAVAVAPNTTVIPASNLVAFLAGRPPRR